MNRKQSGDPRLHDRGQIVDSLFSQRGAPATRLANQRGKVEDLRPGRLCDEPGKNRYDPGRIV